MEIDTQTKKRRQDEKERAVKEALVQGVAILKRNLDIVLIKSSGEEVTLVKEGNWDTIWAEAHAALMSVDKNTTICHERLKVYTDGGSRGNPGPSASGYVIMAEDDAIIEEGGEYLGITTNNQAEYQAVKLALEQCEKYCNDLVDFYIDSLLVVNQMNGVWKIKNKDLWPVHEAIQQQRKKFKKVTFTHVRREFNKLADAKVNEVLDSRRDHEQPEHL